jgi:hypothetical protein
MLPICNNRHIKLIQNGFLYEIGLIGIFFHNLTLEIIFLPFEVARPNGRWRLWYRNHRVAQAAGRLSPGFGRDAGPKMSAQRVEGLSSIGIEEA